MKYDDAVVRVGGEVFTSIYEAMIAGEVPMDHHETDLYVPVTPYTLAVVKGYEFRGNVTTFVSPMDGALWYDIPFAYLPAWDRKPGTQNVGNPAQVPTIGVA